MAQKNEIRYIQFYTDGSAARQLELNPLAPKKNPQPRRRRQKKIVLHVDFLAMAGIVVAAVMLILMMVGASGLISAGEEVARMESYIAQLENEQIQLQKTYQQSYDLEQIRMEALEMGLVPAEQVQTVSVQVEPIFVEERTVDHSFWTFLTGLFA